jgi:hypothetical protein
MGVCHAHVVGPVLNFNISLQTSRHCGGTRAHKSNKPEQQEQTYPALQVPKAGWPLTQAAAALLKGAAGVLHAPQFAASVFRSISQPLLATPSQSANLQELGRPCAMHRLTTPKLYDLYGL